MSGERRDETQRLNQFLAAAGVGSRRSADELIKRGRVTVNGLSADIGARVTEEDTVQVDGREIHLRSKKVTLVLNKPPGVVTTVTDTHKRKTVMDLVDWTPGLVPVGRLDLESRGLLLLSNDGELVHRLTHPSRGVVKTYRVVLAGKPTTEATVAELAKRVVLEDGPAKPLSVKKAPAPRSYDIEMGEGRKREVRRICAASGYTVEDLCRIRFGPIRLGGLSEGEWRPLRTSETRSLYACVELDPPDDHLKGSSDV